MNTNTEKHKIKRRVSALLLAVVMLLYLLPLEALASNSLGAVTVIVENQTYTVADGAPWDGILINTTVNLTSESTMMSCIEAALLAQGYEVLGAESNYISSINDLAEFDGGTMSGWMGTLNDWFTNAGFADFSVADGRLSDGDIIRVMYTVEYGADLGGSWYNDSTTLDSLEVSGGTLTPTFSSGIAGADNEYTLLIEGDTAAITLTPTASNKNFMVKTFLNEKVTTNIEGASYYKRSQEIPVQAGDTIYVGCGESAWPSMNDQASGTWYLLRVVNNNLTAVQAVIDLIDALPQASALTIENYQSYTDAITEARAAYALLDSNLQAEVTNYDKLTALEAKVAELCAEQNSTSFGDVNSDGTVNNIDANLVYAYYNAISSVSLSEGQLICADVNGDGVVNNMDAALIYAFYNGKSASFPVEM